MLPGALEHGPSHLADEDATVYAAPNYDDEGNELLDDRLTPTGYQGRYRIDYLDTFGFWAFGDFQGEKLHHAGYAMGPWRL